MIPKKILYEILEDPFYKTCILSGWNGMRIELHHVFQYGKKSIQESWNIVPLITLAHNQVTPHNNKYDPRTRRKVEWLTLKRADLEYLHSVYPKKDWLTLWNKLNDEFGG